MKKTVRVFVLAAFVALAALLSGVVGQSKAQAACSSNGYSGPSTNGNGHNYISGGYRLSCGLYTDWGAVRLYLDYLDQTVFPARWTFAANLAQWSNIRLDDTVGNPGVMYYGNSIACSALSAQYYRVRIQWDNWTSGVYNNQASSPSSSTILCDYIH